MVVIRSEVSTIHEAGEVSVASARNGSDGLIIHYMTMRKTIGWLGLLYPFIVLGWAAINGDFHMRLSISQYYHSGGGDMFVGLLFAQAIFLYAYRGYNFDPDRPGHNFFIKISDNTAGNIAALGALGTALFPTVECDVTGGCGSDLYAYLHWFFSALFFLILSYICLFLFVQTGDVEPTVQKKRRNMVYKTCGYLMLLAMVLAIVKGLVPDEVEAVMDDYHALFWFETLAVMSFGFSWLVKGEQILADMPYEDEEDEAAQPQEG
jgi:hypothetical protein